MLAYKSTNIATQSQNWKHPKIKTVRVIDRFDRRNAKSILVDRLWQELPHDNMARCLAYHDKKYWGGQIGDHQSDETPRDNGKTHYLDRQDVDCGGYPLNGFQMKTGQGGSMISYKYGCLEGARLDVSEVADVCSCGQPFFGLGAHTWINRLTCSVLFVVLFLRMAGEDDFCGR